MNDPHQREYVASIGGDPERQHVEYIRHINEALAGRPEGMSVATHACRGNFRSSWAAEGSWDFVAEALLNELEVDGYFMEWDDERSGGFEPLRFLPKGDKQVVLGLVTTKRGELESRDDLLRRIEEASGYAPIEQLCLSPQCGFSSTVEGNSPHGRGAVGEAPPDRRGGGRGLGLARAELGVGARPDLEQERLVAVERAREHLVETSPKRRRGRAPVAQSQPKNSARPPMSTSGTFGQAESPPSCSASRSMIA